MKRNWYRTSAGALIVTGEFVNSTGSAQQNTKVTIALQNESGNVLSEQSGWTIPRLLPASGRGFFAINMGYQPDTVVNMDVTVVFDSPTGMTLSQRDVSQWASVSLDSFPVAKGVFTNNLENPMYGPRVAVVVRDPLRKILWVGEYVHPSWVISKEQAQWSLTLTTAPTEALQQSSIIEALLVYRSL